MACPGADCLAWLDGRGVFGASGAARRSGALWQCWQRRTEWRGWPRADAPQHAAVCCKFMQRGLVWSGLAWYAWSPTVACRLADDDM
mmetsp:Transcript_19886/g.50458  ORF Transcript_19886/g.50458 Transcript_19886/m.50458 type:complete len:87 (+) Transcript_19886:443-703(+)